ncbi:hypothetical protein Hamer_G031469, partial [Homarus americanus]
MEIQPQRHVRPPRTRANRPEVITSRGRIIGYHEAEKGIRENLSPSWDTVRLWGRRYEEEGHVLTRPRPGRPRVTTPAADQQIQRAAERAPLSTAVRLRRETGVQCQLITTRRRIRETGRQYLTEKPGVICIPKSVQDARWLGAVQYENRFR